MTELSARLEKAFSMRDFNFRKTMNGYLVTCSLAYEDGDGLLEMHVENKEQVKQTFCQIVDELKGWPWR